MLPMMGFPHSDTRGSRLICSSPRLFAACRVLLRRPMPRHSPCALLSLNFMSFANRSKCVSVSLSPSLTRVCSICYPILEEFVRILDLLSLHLCFIQFSRYSALPQGLGTGCLPFPSPLSGRDTLLSQPTKLKRYRLRPSPLGFEPCLLALTSSAGTCVPCAVR